MLEKAQNLNWTSSGGPAMGSASSGVSALIDWGVPPPCLAPGMLSELGTCWIHFLLYGDLEKHNDLLVSCPCPLLWALGLPPNLPSTPCFSAQGGLIRTTQNTLVLLGAPEKASSLVDSLIQTPTVLA